MNARTFRKLVLALCTAMVLAALTLVAGGCTTTVITAEVPLADGRTLKVKGERYRFAHEDSLDELTVPTPAGPATLKGYKSDSKLAEAAADIAAAAKNFSAAGAKAVGVP